MAARLTDAQKKQIIADYAESGSYKATAKHFGVSDNTVRRLCRNDPEISQKVAQKKKQNTADMLSFMESRKIKAQEVIDTCLELLPEKIKSASAAQTATTLGIIIDKFTKQTDAGMNIGEIMKNSQTLAEIVMHPVKNRDFTDYENNCVLAKNALDADLYGQQGYEQRLKELAAERDTAVENALSGILTVADEYDAEMAELGRLDGGMIDDGTMKLLNSGLTLTSKDWQELANRHKDNAVMSRILKERYDANRPAEKGPGITIVRFGQSPADRSEVFGKFVRTVYHAAESGVRPSLSGGGRLKTVTDYYNFIAQDSLKGMQPFGDELFDNLDKDFLVETENGKVENAGSRTSSFSPSDFGFNFTPVR